MLGVFLWLVSFYEVTEEPFQGDSEPLNKIPIPPQAINIILAATAVFLRHGACGLDK